VLERLAALAATQGGVFTRGQADQAGYASADIRRHVTGGHWVVVRRGAYAERSVYEGAQADPHGRHALDTAAVLLRTKAGAVASHTSAARLYRTSFIGGWPVAPTITVPRDGHVTTRPKRTRWLDRRVAKLPDGHVTTDPGMPATAPARTLVDVSRELTFAEGVVVADNLLRRDLVEKTEVDHVLAFCERWPGIGRAKKVAAFGDGRAESPLESYGRAVLHLQGVPPLEPQVWLYDSRGLIGRVDLYSEEFFTVVEFDGLVKYDGSNEDSLLAEKLRQERLEEAGFVVVRATFRQLDREPAGTAERVTAGFRRSLRRRADAAPGEFTGYVGTPPPGWAVRLPRHFTPE